MLSEVKNKVKQLVYCINLSKVLQCVYTIKYF